MAKTSSGPLAALTQRAKRLDAEIARLGNEWRSYISSSDMEAVEALPALEAVSAQLDHGLRASIAVASELLEIVRQRHQRESDSYSVRVSDALREAGYNPVGDTTRPVIEGSVFLDIDPRAPFVRINDRRTDDLRPGSVARQVGEVLQEIRRAVTPPDSFIAELERAYDEERRPLNVAAGAQVHLQMIHLRILMNRQSKAFRSDPRTTTFKGYPLEVFRADLYTVLMSGPPAPSGRLLRLTSGSDTQGAVFMLRPDLDRPGYAGRLYFEELPK